MARNLTKRLKRQDTSDSHGKQRAEEIFQEKTYNLGIDEFDINTEIIKLMAGEILQKTEFFDMIKKSNLKQQNQANDEQNFGNIGAIKSSKGSPELVKNEKERLDNSAS